MRIKRFDYEEYKEFCKDNNFKLGESFWDNYSIRDYLYVDLDDSIERFNYRILNRDYLLEILLEDKCIKEPNIIEKEYQTLKNKLGIHYAKDIIDEELNIYRAFYNGSYKQAYDICCKDIIDYSKYYKLYIENKNEIDEIVIQYFK